MYDVKVVNCGNIVEIYKYKQPIKTGYKVKEQKSVRLVLIILGQADASINVVKRKKIRAAHT